MTRKELSKDCTIPKWIQVFCLHNRRWPPQNHGQMLSESKTLQIQGFLKILVRLTIACVTKVQR